MIAHVWSLSIANLAALPWGWSLEDLAVAIVVIAAICALVYVALRRFGVVIPAWFVEVFWIVVAAFVVILAIRVVASL